MSHLMYCAGACFSAALTGMAADILEEVSFSSAALVASVASLTASSSGRCSSSSLSPYTSLGSRSVNLLYTTLSFE